ncbi:MAG: type II secretion system protein [Calothrix sp. SM1_5_4]|nr:type II secretion system protein [Calothrix sp. SM1_5_4]
MDSQSAASRKGFTLIELMIVVAILAAAVVTAMPYLSNRNSQNKAFLRELTVLSRELHTRAKLNGVAYRLVIDMAEAGDGSRAPAQKFWVERGTAKAVLKETEEEDAMKREQHGGDEAKKDPKGFEMDNSMIKEPRRLPSGLRIERVELTRVKSPLTSGKAFIHYLPQGLVDEAAIHIKGEKKPGVDRGDPPSYGKGRTDLEISLAQGDQLAMKRFTRNGFTLLEVLVALFILTGAILVTANSWSGNFMRMRKAQLYNNVATLLERKMVEVEAKYKGKPIGEIPDSEGGDFGSDHPQYRWELKSRELKLPDLTPLLVQEDGADEMLITMMKQLTEQLSKAIKEVRVTIFVKGKGRTKEMEFPATQYFIDYDSGLAGLPGGDPGGSAK